MDTPDDVRARAVNAVRWLKTSRARAAPDALATIAYLAAREQVLEKRLRDIARAVLTGGSDDPAEQA